MGGKATPSKMPMIVLALGLIVLLVGLGLFLMEGARKGNLVTVSEGAGSGTAQIGGPFELIDQEGALRRDSEFSGRYMLVYFGYTYCPDFCPASLSVMTQALDLLAETSPDQAAQVQPIFITIDPERDTVAALKDYAMHFHPRFVNLTGSLEQVSEAARGYRVFFRKVEDESATEYLVDHSTFTYLMGPDGAYVTHFSHEADAVSMAEKLAEVLS